MWREKGEVEREIIMLITNLLWGRLQRLKMIFGFTHHFFDDCKNFLAATFQTVEYGIFSSPDSDDTFPGEESEDVSMRDDQFLVADRSENKFYGTVRGGSTPAGAGPSLGNIGRKLQVNIHTVTLSSSK